MDTTQNPYTLDSTHFLPEQWNEPTAACLEWNSTVAIALHNLDKQAGPIASQIYEEWAYDEFNGTNGKQIARKVSKYAN